MVAKQTYAKKSTLMDVLWDIQKKRRHISHDDKTKIAKAFNISRMELEGVISFYHFIHRKHAGKYTIYLNCSTISKLHDYQAVKEAFEEALGIKIGNVTKDNLFGFLKPLA
jgi:[NiFe] hydrogenase diaphorase moiety large subunit